MSTKSNAGNVRRSKNVGKSATITATGINGRVMLASLGKTAKPKLTNARLRKLAATHRPPQSWYDENSDLF